MSSRRMSASIPSTVAAAMACAVTAAPPVRSSAPKTDGPDAVASVIDPTAIRLGMVTALSGPSGNLGANMRAGILAAFDEANRAGGVHGRRVELIVRDDRYEPSTSAPATRELLTEHGILAMVGNVGTPTAVVALPLCREAGAPFIGPFTGAGILRTAPPDPADPLVFHLRASYQEETASIVNALIDHAGLRPGEIGILTQRDSFGDSGYQGTLLALRGRGLPEAARPPHRRYERNSVAVESAVADFLLASPRPKAIVMVGTYAPCAAFIRLCHESDYRPHFIAVSFVGAESLARELGTDGDGVIVTQVVPPLDSDLPIIGDMAQALVVLPADVRREPSLGTLEGYAVGRLVLGALARIQPDQPPTRDSLAAAMAALGPFDLGLGVPLRFTHTDHQASHTVWPSILKDGRVRSMQWEELSRLAPGAPDPHAAVSDERP